MRTFVVAVVAAALAISLQVGPSPAAGFDRRAPGPDVALRVTGTVLDPDGGALSGHVLELWAGVPRTRAEARRRSAQSLMRLGAAVSDERGRYTLTVPHSPELSRVVRDQGYVDGRVVSVDLSGPVVHAGVALDVGQAARRSSTPAAAAAPTHVALQPLTAATPMGRASDAADNPCGRPRQYCHGPYRACRQGEWPVWRDHARSWDEDRRLKLAHVKTYRKWSTTIRVFNGERQSSSLIVKLGAGASWASRGESRTEFDNWAMSQRIPPRKNVMVRAETTFRKHELYCRSNVAGSIYDRGTAVAEYYPYRATGWLGARRTQKAYPVKCAKVLRALRGGYALTVMRGRTVTFSRGFSLEGVAGRALLGLSRTRDVSTTTGNARVMTLEVPFSQRGGLCANGTELAYASRIRELLPRDMG